MRGRLWRWGAAVGIGVLAAGLGAPPALADAIRDRQWHLDALKVVEAHRITRGAGVTVAVIDTGVRADHRDLTGNVLPGLDLTGAGTDGRQDTHGHGTSMAGLIAGHGHGPGNADGALGIAPQAKILPIRDARSEIGSPDNVPDAIDQAVRRGAKVVSMSLSTGSFARLREAVQHALAADVVLVASVGNRPDAGFVGFPAAYPGVLAVGATGRDGQLDSVSVTGAATVLTAPGADITSTSRTGAYQVATGTSDATAIVAGAAALVRSKFPKLPATEVVHRLTATADDRGAPGRDPQYGFGGLDLVAALTADVRPAGTPAPGAGATPSADPASEPAAAPPGDDEVGLRPSAALYVVGGFLLLALLAGVGAAGWLLARARRDRAHGGGAPPPVPGYPPGYSAPPPPTHPGYPAPGYPAPSYPPPTAGPPQGHPSSGHGPPAPPYPPSGRGG
ncbi:type VII secretion-associated serine protease mycosin [Plantactinospora sp. CA-290183]|uniref:type VII secretion-associated serine protease mycosin n=1 Tax=Plantactinospora sp. CA-290183 TaxID=3240006 RepID=UPI003D947E58